MKSIEDLLKNLARPEVLEFGLVTNRLPSVNIGGKFEPVDDEAPSTKKLLDMLVSLGGATHVKTLSEKPIQWTYRVEGIGVVAVAAIMRKDVVQARFTLAKRDARFATTQSGPPPPQRAVDRPSQQPVPARPPSQFRTTQQGPGPTAPTAPPAKPSSGASLAAGPPSSLQRVAAAPPVPPPPEEEREDDDEPTVQTLSPPVKGRPGQPAPKEGGSQPPRAVSAPPPQLALDPEPLAASASPPPAPVAPAAKPPAAPAPAPAPSPSPSPPPASASAAPQPTTQPSGPPPLGPMRIPTPTSVDMVEIDQALKERAAKAQQEKAEKKAPEPDDNDGVDQTVEVRPSQSPPPKPVTAAMPSAVPSTAPSAVLPEKDRPRVDGAALESFLAMATAARASDIHVVAGRPVLARVASDLLPRTQPVPPETVERIAREIVPSRLREALTSEGACGFAIEHAQHGRFRVNVSRQRTGYKLSLRVVGREAPTFASLGLPDKLASTAKLQQGIVIVAGPSGQGKSSTLAAIVDHLNRETHHHILTIEDPIEVVHVRKRAVVTQRELGTHVRSLPGALTSAAAADVDVIVIGELRDAVAVRTAISAAESGRLVLTTMNVTSAAKAIERLVDAFPDAESARARARIASMLRLVLSQRLVPSADRTRLVAAVEVLPMSLALAAVVRDGKLDQIHALQKQARGGGVRLDESLAELVRAQKVTPEVAKQFAESAVELDAIISRKKG